MNKGILLKHIKNYKKNYSQKLEDDLKERTDKVLYYKSWTKNRILKMTTDEFEEYISKLWAMLIWGNKKYKTDQIIDSNGFDTVKKGLAELIWGSSGIEKRWDKFREEIKGFGPAMMSELLNATHPDKYALWNRRAFVGLRYLEAKGLPHYDYQLDGKKYSEICGIAKDIAKLLEDNGFENVDLLYVDYFIWDELQVEKTLSKIHDKKEVKNNIEKNLEKDDKVSRFVHNDIRDKIADIGNWLGFETETEKGIAAGARVDVLWRASIGNLGAVTYVFEVQRKGSIDGAILNLQRALNNPSVQKIIAVSDAKQLEQIRKEVAGLPENFRRILTFWEASDVIETHGNLSEAMESIAELDLVKSQFEDIAKT